MPDPAPPHPIEGDERRGEPEEVEIPVPAGAAHTYTECARIWNPIHTDKAVALAAGLPDIILHGTANLALGVSAVIGLRADDRPERGPADLVPVRSHGPHAVDRHGPDLAGQRHGRGDVDRAIRGAQRRRRSGRRRRGAGAGLSTENLPATDG